jgi:hypothetical protein
MIKELQVRFRLKLTDLRHRQLEQAYRHKLDMLKKWQKQEEKWKDWQRRCVKAQVYFVEHVDPSYWIVSIPRFLSLLVGINPGHGFPGRRPSYDEAFGGLPGFRSCSGPCWDNAVRAVEEG